MSVNTAEPLTKRQALIVSDRLNMEHQVLEHRLDTEKGNPYPLLAEMDANEEVNARVLAMIAEIDGVV